jgi:hypothetical protein
MQESVILPPSSPLVDPFVFAKHFTVDPSPPPISSQYSTPLSPLNFANIQLHHSSCSSSFSLPFSIPPLCSFPLHRTLLFSSILLLFSSYYLISVSSSALFFSPLVSYRLIHLVPSFLYLLISIFDCAHKASILDEATKFEGETSEFTRAFRSSGVYISSPPPPPPRVYVCLHFVILFRLFYLLL